MKKSGKTGAYTAKKQHSGFRSSENPNAEIPQAEKQAQLNTNEKINKKKKLSYQDSISPSAPQRKFQKKFQHSFNVEKSIGEDNPSTFSK